ncbi:MAG: outer membrane beta-barrel protein [Candidatus Aminicenantes bacterium]|nr:outer membrane beta-barrel protein [Candidatus Aminicenantes bacterium]
MIKKTTVLLSLLIVAAPVLASDYSAGLKISYFNPATQIFKNIYGNGAILGIKARKKGVFKNIGVILEAGYLKNQGKLTFSKEDTTVQIFFLGPGLIYQHTVGRFDLYGGAGLRYVHFKERNRIGNVTTGKMGTFISIGSYFQVTEKLVADLSISFSGCQVKPADVKVEIGGLEIGVGIGYQF